MATLFRPTRHGIADILSSNICTAPRQGGYTMMKLHISLIINMRCRRMAMPLRTTWHCVADILSLNIEFNHEFQSGYTMMKPHISLLIIMRCRRDGYAAPSNAAWCSGHPGSYTMMKPHISLIIIMRRRRDGYAAPSNVALCSGHSVFEHWYRWQDLFHHEEPQISS
ncbi:hypothetical protein J6590_101211 [Homalodisca vitripennis]|nr:hypothetical protein J6590_101211 [Homalodisca vitripennis]